MVRKFTDSLAELFVSQNLSLAESLAVMAGEAGGCGDFSKKSRLQKISSFLLNALRQGNPLSNSMQECPYASFDSVYVSFIMLAERSGNLKETVAFLKRRCERSHECAEKVVEAALYPAFVVCAAITGGGFLLRYTGTALDANLVAGFLTLCALSAGIFALFRHFLKEDSFAEVFFAMDFLTKNGHSVSSAAGFAVLIAGENSAFGNRLLEAKRKLEYGMRLCEAFSLKGRAGELLFLAERGETSVDVFSRIAEYHEDVSERRRKICITLVEPAFICIAGLFMLLVVLDVFLPFMNDYSWM